MAPAYVVRGRFWAGPGTVNGWGTNLPMEGASPRFNSRGGIPHRDHGPAPLSPCLAHAVLSILLRGPFRLTRNVHAPQTSLDGTPGGPRRRRPKPRPCSRPWGPCSGPNPPPAAPPLPRARGGRGGPGRSQERGRGVVGPSGRARRAPGTAESAGGMGARPPQAEALGRGGAGCPRGSDCSIPSSVRRDLRRTKAPEGPSVGRTALPPHPFQGPEGGVLAV